MITTTGAYAFSFLVGFGAVICTPPAPQDPAAAVAPKCTDVLTCTGSSYVNIVSGFGVAAAITSTTANTQKCYCYDSDAEGRMCTGYGCDYTATFTIQVPGASSTAPYGNPAYCTQNLVQGVHSDTLNPPSCGGSNYAAYYFSSSTDCSGTKMAEVFVHAACSSSQCAGWYCPPN